MKWYKWHTLEYGRNTFIYTKDPKNTLSDHYFYEGRWTISKGTNSYGWVPSCVLELALLEGTVGPE